MDKSTQEPLQPMVLCIGCNPIVVAEEMGMNGLTASCEYLGHVPIFVGLAVEASPWWVNPDRQSGGQVGWDQLLYAIHDGNLSPNQLFSWLTTKEFERTARARINRNIREALGLKGGGGFDRRWHEAVRLVVLNNKLRTGWSQRVFDGYFKTAQGKYWGFYESHAQGMKLAPIWRDAEVTPIVRELSGSTDDLGQRCDQLGLQPPQIGNKLVNAGLTTLADLVLASSDQVHGILGGNEEHYTRVLELVWSKGLRLNMDEERVAVLRQDGPWFIVREAMTPSARSERVTKAEFMAATETERVSAG